MHGFDHLKSDTLSPFENVENGHMLLTILPGSDVKDNQRRVLADIHNIV